MNTLRFTTVMVLVCLLIQFYCIALGHPTKMNKSPSKTSQRRSGSGYVDFGAHTGPLGSYGWYVDFPANKN